MNELEALQLLTHIPYLGSIKIRLMIQHFGSALAAVEADPYALAELPGFGSKVIQAWQEYRHKEEWKDNLRIVEKYQTQLIAYTDPLYPKRLLELVDYPLILYVQGTLKKEDHRCLAIIGTRQASFYGLEMARKISRDLVQAGFVVVSGFARGIDTAAHEGALEGGGRTIGVLGSGLANLYPKENEILARNVIHHGVLMSEFPMMTPPDKQHFPQRNRIVSGMTLGTILIEAPHHSGAMLTAERALSQGRKVFALPGRADQENFRGNHRLIKNGQAILIESADDVISCFTDLFGPRSSHTPCVSLSHYPLEKEEEILLRQLPSEELSIEDIATLIKWPIVKLNILLMSLVLKKMIKEYPGKIYKKI